MDERIKANIVEEEGTFLEDIKEGIKDDESVWEPISFYTNKNSNIC